MARKPDRFERMVNSSFGVVISNNQVDAGVANYMYREDAVKLLRRQHRAYVRQINNIVKASQAIADNYMLSLQTREFYQMRVKAAEDILHQVNQYKR